MIQVPHFFSNHRIQFSPTHLDDRQVGIIFPDRTNFNIFQKDEKTYSINSPIKTKIMTSKRLRNYFTLFSKMEKNNERSHQHNDSASNVSNLSSTLLSPLFRFSWLDDPIVHLSSCCGIRTVILYYNRTDFAFDFFVSFQIQLTVSSMNELR